MLILIIEALIFILPTYISNSFASLSMSIPILKDWDTPIDFGKSWNDKRVFGDGKTFRGFLFGTFCALFGGLIQYFIAKSYTFEHITKFNEFSTLTFLLLSALLGFGGLAGDAIKSLIKRRVGIKRGRPWPPFDQLDFIFGTEGYRIASTAHGPLDSFL